MKIFDFSENIIDTVAEELENADKYIRIAIFQIHNEKIFDVIEKQLSNGVKVDVITLPYDSINEDIKEEITKRLDDLVSKGLNLYFCRWNVGDPERTTTAVGRWYSFHGKFIVTEKVAIALSSNFTRTNELDAAIIYRDDTDRIEEFNAKFDELKELFIDEYDGDFGKIKSMVLETRIDNVEEVFELPKVIPKGVHDKTWIQHYPKELCPENVRIEEKLYLIPFDCRGRELIKEIADEAEEFIFLSTESFTDKDFPDFIKKMKLKGIDIKILTGYRSMDFNDRIQKFMKELMAVGVELKTIDTELHGKLWITDKSVVVSSINLNKMNLGFSKSNFWRENTETANICRDEKLINDARKRFLEIFDTAIPIEDKFAEKNISNVGHFFNKTFNVSISGEAKEIFSKLTIKNEIKNYDILFRLAKLSSQKAKENGLKKVDREILEEAMRFLGIN